MNDLKALEKEIDELRQEFKNDATDVNKIDGWFNALAGIGGKMDKRSSTVYRDFIYLEAEELSRMFVGDGLGKKIVSAMADDMTREWIELPGDDDNVIMKELNRLESEKKYNLVLKWQRLFGGSMLLIGAMGSGNLEEPLNLNRVTAVDYLTDIDKSDIEISQSTFFDDPNKPNFGKVEKYRVNLRVSPQRQVYTYIHSSRVVEFFGEPIPKRMTAISQDYQYWGVSVLQAAWEKLRDMGGTMASVCNILYEYVIGIFKFENLVDMLKAGNEGKLLNRMEIINMTKSIINAVLLGKNEEFDRNTANLTGLPDVVDRVMIMLAAVTGYPATRLFGTSPAGQNATGESDLRNYYDVIRSKQKLDLKHPLQYLVDILSAVKGVESPMVEFRPLKQMTEFETADLEKKNAETKKSVAETDKIYMETGVVTAKDVTKRLEEEIE